MRRTSRLWKRLGATAPLFRVWSEDGLEMIDHNMTSINISRGTAGPAAGIEPQTLEVGTVFALNPRTDFRVHCDLTDYGANRLQSITGARADITKPRFYGRIGNMKMEDVQYPNRQVTTLSAATWDAQLKRMDVEWTIFDGEPVAAVLRKLSAPTGVGMDHLPAHFTPADNTLYGYSKEQLTGVTYSDGITKFAEDTGIYGKVMRDGRVYWQPNEYRYNQALTELEHTVPLTRSNALSPATWDQPVENSRRVHRVMWWHGNTYRDNNFGSEARNPNLPVEEHDMSQVNWSTNQNQPLTAATTFVERDAARRWRIPSLTIDLLRLIDSPHQSHVDQARQLLELEVGDPIFLSADWYGQLRGVHFAVGIDESITPDGWDLTLNLAPSAQVIGYDSPPVPPMTWESTGDRWQDMTGTWANPR